MPIVQTMDKSLAEGEEFTLSRLFSQWNQKHSSLLALYQAAAQQHITKRRYLNAAVILFF